MTLNRIDRELLVTLRKGGHVKGNPTHAWDLLPDDRFEIDSSVRRLHQAELVKRSIDQTRPGSPFVRLSDTGIAQADLLIEDNDREAKPNSRVQIVNTFSPTNTVNVSERRNSKDTSGWWNLGFAIAIGAAGIFVSLWAGGKI